MVVFLKKTKTIIIAAQSIVGNLKDFCLWMKIFPALIAKNVLKGLSVLTPTVNE